MVRKYRIKTIRRPDGCDAPGLESGRTQPRQVQPRFGFAGVPPSTGRSICAGGSAEDFVVTVCGRWRGSGDGEGGDREGGEGSGGVWAPLRRGRG
eukprot:scaffold14885_cov65-Phaeocystis_antarctica.AAC.19